MNSQLATQSANATALKSPINWYANPITAEDHLARIEELSDRILRRVQFISSITGLDGTSGEARQLALAGFYACLSTTERTLNRIENDLRLA